MVLGITPNTKFVYSLKSAFSYENADFYISPLLHHIFLFGGYFQLTTSRRGRRGNL